jgi:hypothetical protein
MAPTDSPIFPSNRIVSPSRQKVAKAVVRAPSLVNAHTLCKSVTHERLSLSQSNQWFSVIAFFKVAAGGD